MQEIIVRILITIVALVIIGVFIQPLLLAIAAPYAIFGVIILIALYLLVLAYLFGWVKWPQ